MRSSFVDHVCVFLSGWTCAHNTKLHLFNFLVACRGRVFFWALKEIEGKADAAAICDQLRPILTDLGALNVKSVVLDGASVTNAQWRT